MGFGSRESRAKGKVRAVGAAAVAGIMATAGVSAASSKPHVHQHAVHHRVHRNISGSIIYGWWGDPNRNAHTYAVIKLFQRAYPNVRVTGSEQAFNQYWQKVTAEAASGTLPCVTQTQSRELTSYTPNHVFMNLNSLIKSGEIKVNAMPKSILAAGTIGGNVYMIPYGAGYLGLMYNEGVLHKLHIAAPSPDVTWTGFGQWLAALRKKIPASMYPMDNDGWLADPFIAYAESYGHSLFNKQGQLGFNGSFLKQYWSMWLKWQKEKLIDPESLSAQEATAIEQSYLVQKKVVVESEPGNQEQDAQLAADQLHTGRLKAMGYPYGPAGTGNYFVVSGLSIPARGCSNVKAAAAFINFFTNNPAAAKAFASNNGPVTDTALLEQQVNGKSTPTSVRQYLQVAQYIVAHGARQITYPPGYTIVFQTLFPQIYQKIAAGQESLSAGVASFMSQAKSDLAAG